MNQSASFERRLAELVGEYANRAPIDVDPLGMARIASTAVNVVLPSRFGWRMPRPGLVLAILAIAIAMIGAVLASGSNPFLRDQTWAPVEGVLPFEGLPPEGAAASVPKHGELVLSFAARMTTLGMEVQQASLFADGRWIWHRNLEGSGEGNSVFGDLEPTRAVIEQRLTREGVELILADVKAAISMVGANGGPGTLWGQIGLVVDGRLQGIGWNDGNLPARLADPGSWLPPSAWADRELRGYVPWRYAVCHGRDVTLADMPSAAADVLRGQASFAGPGNPSVGTCYIVTTEVAREIAAGIEAAGRFVRCDPVSNQFFDRPAKLNECGYRGITFSEVLPDGELILRGG